MEFKIFVLFQLTGRLDFSDEGYNHIIVILRITQTR